MFLAPWRLVISDHDKQSIEKIHLCHSRCYAIRAICSVYHARRVASVCIRRRHRGAERMEDNVSAKDHPIAPSGKEIRLTEYAACAG